MLEKLIMHTFHIRMERSKLILQQVFSHYSITPALLYSNTPYGVFQGNRLLGVTQGQFLWARILYYFNADQ